MSMLPILEYLGLVSSQSKIHDGSASNPSTTMHSRIVCITMVELHKSLVSSTNTVVRQKDDQLRSAANDFKKTAAFAPTLHYVQFCALIRDALASSAAKAEKLRQLRADRMIN